MKKGEYILFRVYMAETAYKIDLKDSKTLLISDFEGTTPTAHFEKFKEYCTDINPNTNVLDPVKRVIFLGDVFDNTAQFGKKCKGDKCDDPDDDIGNCVDDSNYVALETIKLLVDNEERCKFVVGNRDINKIKLIPFFSFQTGEKWWTKGESYNEIVKNLLAALITSNNPWLIKEDQLKYFRPFWKQTDPSFNEGWIENKDINITNIYDRFERIFGKDPSKGTMSALVSLKCIPNELISDMEKFYFQVDENYYSTIPKFDVKWRKKVRAALTITIFMRMLDKDLWIKENKEKNKTEFGALDGYLYYYLTQAPAAYCAEYDKNLFLFAHGGITNDFVNGNGQTEIDKIKKRDRVDWEKKLVYKQKGGQNNQIIKSINYYNKAFLELVKNFFDTKFDDPNGKWIETMLTLLDLSAGGKTNPNQVKEPYGENLDTYKDTYEKIYNVFGHASISSGYTFGKTRDKNGKVIGNDTYFLSTDYSTTLFKNGIVCDEKTKGSDSEYNKNYLLAILDTTEPKIKLVIDGEIILQNGLNKSYEFTPSGDKPIQEFSTDVDITVNKKLFLPEKIVKEKMITLKFDDSINLFDQIDRIDKENTTNNICFNGIARVGNDTYNIYSSRYNNKKQNSIILLPFEGGTQVNQAATSEAATREAAKATSEAATANATSEAATREAAKATSEAATSEAATLEAKEKEAKAALEDKDKEAKEKEAAAKTTTKNPTGSATTGEEKPTGPEKPTGSATPGATKAKKTVGVKSGKNGMRDPFRINDPILLEKDTETGDYIQQVGGKRTFRKSTTKKDFLKKVGPKTRRKHFSKKSRKTRKTQWKKVGPKTRKLKYRKLKYRKLKYRKKSRKTLKKN